MGDRSPGAPAGWYPDENMAGTLRYWDGDAWTDEVRPAESPARPSGHASTETASSGDRLPTWAKVLIGVAVAGILYVLVVAVTFSIWRTDRLPEDDFDCVSEALENPSADADC